MLSLPVHPNCYKNFFLIFSSSIGMSGKNVTFGDKTIKSDFYKNKKVIKIDNTDFNKILVSKEEPYGTKNSFNTLLIP